MGLIDVLPRRVRLHEPEEVTSVDPGEADPRDLGLSRRVVEDIWRSVVDFYKTGLHPSLALCLRYQGQIVINRTIGHARGNRPGRWGEEEAVLATPKTLYNLFSASKAVTAMLIHHLDDQGLVHLDDAVAEYIPEFARHGKEFITVKHVLTHRAGIPTVPGETIDLEMLTDPGEIIRVLCDAHPTFIAGRRLAYHAITGGFILGEIIRRVTGKEIRDYLTEAVREPLGMETFNYGVPEARIPDLAEEVFTGPVPPKPLGWLLSRALGAGMDEVVDLANDPRFLTGVVPAGNVIGTAEEVCRFFEVLLREGQLNGARVFDRRTVRRATLEQSYLELDTIIMLPVRYGAGFMLGGDYLSFYGLGTPRAFGHLGLSNILAWADPERDISVALLNNGKPFITPELLLWLNIPRGISSAFSRRA